jgi:uncharacterized protein
MRSDERVGNMTSVVTVEGTAVAAARPDEVEISLEVTYLDRSPHEALAEVATRSTDLEKLLAEIGIEGHQWTTSGAVVNERSEWNRETGQHIHRGYLASNRIFLRLEDAAIVGRLMNEATRRAQARISGPRWQIAPDNPARVEACRLAALEARRKAEAYATALGARLGAVVDIREPGLDNEPSYSVGAPRAMMSMAADAPDAEINVHAGDLQVSGHVIVKFALLQD